MADETKEERDARVRAEARAKADADVRAREAAAAEAERKKDAELFIVYSIFPFLNITVTPQEKHKVQMDTGKWTEIETQKNVNYQFRNFRARMPRKHIKALRSAPGYGMNFLEGLDLKDGDPNATSLEAGFKRHDKRIRNFISQMTRHGYNAGVPGEPDSEVLREEIENMRADFGLTEEQRQQRRNEIKKAALMRKLELAQMAGVLA